MFEADADKVLECTTLDIADCKSIQRSIKRVKNNLLLLKGERVRRRKLRNRSRDDKRIEQSDVEYGFQYNDDTFLDVREGTFELVGKPDWRTVASYSGYYAGFVLVLCHTTRQAMIRRYAKYDGCSSCGYGGYGSSTGIDDALGNVSDSCVITLKQMLFRASHLIDPHMTRRRLSPEDYHYRPLVCLYTNFIWHMSPEREPYRDVQAERKEYNEEIWKAIVRVQAVWRGWLFRCRVLYNPHTDIGQRYLQRQWQSLQKI